MSMQFPNDPGAPMAALKRAELAMSQYIAARAGRNRQGKWIEDPRPDSRSSRQPAERGGRRDGYESGDQIHSPAFVLAPMRRLIGATAHVASWRAR